MKLLRLLLTTSLFAAVSLHSAHAAEIVGFRTMDVHAPSRDSHLNVAIWYPASPGGERVLVGEDRLFKGTEAWRDAPLRDGSFPLILVSHGSGGRISSLDWIAARLAAAGFIVAGPNHPGTTSGNSTPADTIRIWQRAGDLSEVATALMHDPAWKRSIDEKRIGAFGFSLGAHTVLALAGARVDLEDFVRYCDNYPSMPDCVWYASGKVDLRKTDKKRFEKSFRDPRFTSIVAIDPAFAQAFMRDSLQTIAVPVHIINLGEGEAVPLAVQFDRIVKEIPSATYGNVKGSVHMSFLAECQPGGREWLKLIGERDPLCDDAEGSPRTRADIHAELASRIEKAFRRDLMK